MALSCRKQETPAAPCNPEAASLTLSVEIPKISLGTKSASISSIENGHIVSDPFGENLSNWTDNEKLIDGRLMYRLTVFLINRETSRLAGYRDIYLGSDDIKGSSDTDFGANGFKVGERVIDTKYSSEAVISFRYDSPLHNISQDEGQTGTPISPEQLDRGEYRLIAVANWSPVDIEIQQEGATVIQKYPGLKDHNGNVVLPDYVESFKEEFKAQTPTTMKEFRDYTNYHNMLDCTIHSDSEQFLCDLAPQPLVLVKDFVLNPGENYVSAQLRRAWTRIRVTVENISNHELTVHSLSFGDNTTKDETYLFAVPGNEEATLPKPHEHASYGAPHIEAEDGLSHYNALKTFTPETKIQGLDLSTSDAAQNNTVVLFDGYILESDGKGEEFSYNLDLEYAGAQTDHLMRVKKADGSWDIITEDVNEIEDGGLYVLQGRGNKKYVITIDPKSGLSIFPNKNYTGSDYFIDSKYTEFKEDMVFRFVRDTQTPSQKVNARNGGAEVTPVKEVTFPRYWVQTYDKKYWWGTPTSKIECIQLVAENPTAFIVRNDGCFTKGTMNESNILLWSTVEDPNQKGTYGYVNINGKNSGIINGWAGDSQWPGDDSGSQFHLNKVELVTKDARFNDKVTLSVTDPNTSASSKVKAIRRNDFINIYITASYSDKSGEFKFEVMDWKNKDFEIGFE